MSSWLNFNESLSNIKGQISTFANNVLADDAATEGANSTTTEDFKKLCAQKDLEIEHLKKINEELQRPLVVFGQHEPNENNWDWTTTPDLNDKPGKENVSNLKQIIKDLENEKNHLLNQLEQLDVENQQNLAELVGIREKLQQENNELMNKNLQLKQQNETLMSSEANLKEKVNDLLDKLNSDNDSLLKTIQDQDEKIKELTTKLTNAELQNRTSIDKLRKAEEIINSSELKSLEDAENYQKLASILDAYEKQVSSLKGELANKNTSSPNKQLEKSYRELKIQLNESIETIKNLQTTNEQLEQSNKQLSDSIETLRNVSDQYKVVMEEQEKEIAQLKNEAVQFDWYRIFSEIEAIKNILIHQVKNGHSGWNEILKQIEETMNVLNKLHHQTEGEQCKWSEIFEGFESVRDILIKSITDNKLVVELIDNKYLDIIKNKLHEHADSVITVPHSAVHSYENKNPEVVDFCLKIENIFQSLQHYKEKCESLEQDLIESSNEKTKILNDKYNEFEKLMKNSEELSEEVIKKSESIKELEAEINNLITSNDVLLSELDSVKNAGLQTISESNEDSMVLLETDLENANKRIKELEEIIDSPTRTVAPSNDTSNSSLEGKVVRKQQDYQELLNSFDDLKIDFDERTQKLNETNEKLYDIEAENDELRNSFEKIKADFDNTEYQLTEANFALESLKEEFDAMKLQNESLHQENKELKLQNMNSIDLKSKLNEVKEKWLTEENQRHELESQVKLLTEKLQGSKMAETSLKLQYDTLNKEYSMLMEAKNNSEQSLKSANTKIEEYEKKYTEVLQRYDEVLLRCEELNTLLHEKESYIIKMKQVEQEHQQLKTVAQEMELKQNEEKVMQDRETINLNEQLRKNAATLKEYEDENIALVKFNFQQKENIDNLSEQLKASHDTITKLELLIRDKNNELEQVKKNLASAVEIGEASNTAEKEKLQDEIANLRITLKESQDNVALLQQQIQEVVNSRQELVNMVTIKHQESINYHNEIQRLSEILKSETQKYVELESKLVQAGVANDDIARKNEEIDKLSDQINFLNEKCDVLTKSLLEEQSKLQQLQMEKSGPSEKEISLSKQLERLQSHLVELEERSTQELLQAEQRNAELQAKVTDLEQREKNSNTLYTSVSIRANQQVETLQSQLHMVTSQREELRKKISDAEDMSNKQAAALANLQFVLEQFQKDKEKDVIKETERIRRQITAEKQVQNELRQEIESLKAQLEESKMGLQAAARLSDQLELFKKQNSGLKEEVSQLQQKLSKSQQTIEELTGQTDGKIDKSLIKSLIVGFLSSGDNNKWNKDQVQVLKLIATVLDFNQQDHDKVKMNQPQQGSWFGSLLFPQPSNPNMSQESLSQAFVRFLENESKPRVVPSLLDEQAKKPGGSSTESTKRNTPRSTPSPIVLNEIVLPTFAEFGQSRNSSSILKDVLKDNNV